MGDHIDTYMYIFELYLSLSSSLLSSSLLSSEAQRFLHPCLGLGEGWAEEGGKYWGSEVSRTLSFRYGERPHTLELWNKRDKRRGTARHLSRFDGRRVN
jgi:hypothetical protein